MRKYTICFCLLFAVIAGYGQGLHYETSFNGALAKAALENKPLFILLTPPEIPGQNDLMPSVLPEKREVTDVYNKNFINFKASFVDSVGNRIRNSYNIRVLPALVFLDSQGKLLLKTGGNNASVQRFIDMSNNVLNRVSSGKTLSNYEKVLKSGKMDRKQFEEYITMRQELEIYDNAELADKYVEMMMVSELADYSKVLFVLKMGPYAYGKAFSLLYTNKAIPDSIYKREPFNVRQDINNRIIVNTRLKAIKDKDAKLANNVASFKRGTWGTNNREAQKSYTEEMLTYYIAVKDTVNYYPQASFFYDQYYMNVSADSAKRLQTKMLESLKTNSAARAVLDNSVSAITLVPVSQSGDVANALNNAAYSFYTLGTSNFNYLVKALTWARRSVELNPTPENYDTLAHIMYRLKFYEDAVVTQAKALELAKAAVFSPPNRVPQLQKELDKMKARNL